MMESNRPLILFIFGISLLPKIYSDAFPSLIITKKQDNRYVLADEFQYFGGQQKLLGFSASAEYPLYSACPEESVPLYGTYALEVQGMVTDVTAKPLQQFVEGLFDKYECASQIRTIALQCKDEIREEFAPEGSEQYDIGFLIHEMNTNFEELWIQYENLPEVQEYDFIKFLTVTKDESSGMIMSVRHRIVSGQFLEPDSDSDVCKVDEKHYYFYDLYSIFGDYYYTYYDYHDKILIQVQLAPCEDFLLNTWKLSSFTELNTAAMWNKISPQWREIEKFVREVARELGELFIETGTAKILTLPDVEGTSKLLPPMSKYFWKLIKFKQSNHEDDDKAILIVMHNDPYTPDQEPICNDVSEEFGWAVSNPSYKTGLTYVCPVNESITSKLYKEFKVNYDFFNLKKLLPEIYSVGYPPLILVKKSYVDYSHYAPAENFHYDGGQNNLVKFVTSPLNPLYIACPEKNKISYQKYALEIKKKVTDFEATAMEEFVKGSFNKYDCQSLIKPIVLKNEKKFLVEFIFKGYKQQFDIGYLINETGTNFVELGDQYKTLAGAHEYDFVKFLTVTMDKRWGAIISVQHRIASGQFLKPNLHFGPLPPNEKNLDEYGFDVDSLYKEKNQKKILSSIFGQFNPENSLIKVQLAPHEDFVLNTWKFPSLMDLNTTPIWKQVLPQLKKIEKFVRKVAQALCTNELGELAIETGTAQILQLPKSVFLDKSPKSPVSKYFWKTVQFNQPGHEDDGKAVLIVMHNDPHTVNQKPICRDMSQYLGWSVSNTDYLTGLTYVCPVKENITSKLWYEFRENRDFLNLSNMLMLDSDEEEEEVE